MHTAFSLLENMLTNRCTVFVPLAAQGAYQSHFRWALIKTLISRFFSLKLVIFEKKSMENNLEMLL